MNNMLKDLFNCNTFEDIQHLLMIFFRYKVSRESTTRHAYKITTIMNDMHLVCFLGCSSPEMNHIQSTQKPLY